MVVSCSACGQQYGVTEDVTFHKFPANEERRKKWLNAVQRGTWIPGKRSMLCSKHFSPDKFVYKISGDKIRRYLKPDTVPTIFEGTNRKSKNAAPPKLDTENRASISNTVAVESKSVSPDADAPPSYAPNNMTSSLNLEILAATSVALEPYVIEAEPGLIQREKDTSDEILDSVQILVSKSVTVAGTSSNSVEEKAQDQTKEISNFPRPIKRAYPGTQIRTDLSSLPKRVRQVYPGDFKQLNYNDVTEVSKSWTVLNNYVKKMRTSMKVLQQRNRRLEKRVADLKSVVKFLKNRIVERDSAAVRSCGHSDVPTATEFSSKEDVIHRVSNPLDDHDYISSNDRATS